MILFSYYIHRCIKSIRLKPLHYSLFYPNGTLLVVLVPTFT